MTDKITELLARIESLLSDPRHPDFNLLSECAEIIKGMQIWKKYPDEKPEKFGTNYLVFSNLHGYQIDQYDTRGFQLPSWEVPGVIFFKEIAFLDYPPDLLNLLPKEEV